MYYYIAKILTISEIYPGYDLTHTQINHCSTLQEGTKAEIHLLSFSCCPNQLFQLIGMCLHPVRTFEMETSDYIYLIHRFDRTVVKS